MSPTWMNFDAGAGLDHLAGDLVAQDQAFGAAVRPRTACWSEPQMLVVTTLRMAPRHLAADAEGINAGSVLQFEGRVCNVLDGHLHRALIGDGAVVRHAFSSSLRGSPPHRCGAALGVHDPP